MSAEHGTADHGNADHGNADHGDINITYLKVFAALAALTAIEVLASSFLPLPKFYMALMLVTLAFVKAGMVAAFYMHLKFEGKLLYLVCSAPILLVVLLTLGLMPDIAKRVGATTRAAASPAPAGEGHH